MTAISARAANVHSGAAPSRTAASHALLRVMPLQVKVSVWVFATPLLTPSMRAVAVWLMVTDWSVPAFMITPGSGRPRLPDVSVPPVWLPVTALMSACALQPEESAIRFRSPERLVLTVRKYAPGAVTVTSTFASGTNWNELSRASTSTEMVSPGSGASGIEISTGSGADVDNHRAA